MKKIFILPFLLTIPCLALAAPSDINFTVAMSEAVNVNTSGGTPRIAVNIDGQTRYATYSAGTGTSSLTFSYAPTVGDLDLDGVALTSPLDLNGGIITDLNGNPETDLTFTVPNTSGIKVDYPSLSMDFIADADGRYTLNGTVYNDLSSFLTAAGGSFTRSSTATYFDSTGTLRTASTNTPRFEYDPVTLQPKGLLLESTQTNLILQSNNFTSGPWAKCSSLITSSTTTAPDGSTVSVYPFSNIECLFQDVAISSGVDVTHSIWIKANKTATIGFRIPGISTFTNQDITVGTSWQRYTISNTSSHTVSRLLIDNRSGNGYGVTGLELSFFGAQVEYNSFASSYIPTTSATVTRAADNFTLPIGSWYNAASQTLWGRAYANGANPGSAATFADINNNSFNERFQIRFQGGPLYGGIITSAGSVQSALSGGSLAFGQTKSISLTSSTNNAALSANGNIITTDSSVIMPTAATQLRVGAVANGAEMLNGGLEQLKYYPVRVSNTQLQLLTQ